MRFLGTRLRIKGIRERLCGIDDPGAIARERGYTRQSAAAIGEFGARGPAHKPNHHRPSVVVAKDRCAGVSRTGAEPGALAARCGVPEPDLQRARLTGDDKFGTARRAAALAFAGRGKAGAADDQAVAGRDGAAGWGEPRRLVAKRRRDFKQGNIGAGEIALGGGRVEAGMAPYGHDVFQHWIAGIVIFGDLVIGAWPHAVGGGQHKAAGKCYPAT